MAVQSTFETPRMAFRNLEDLFGDGSITILLDFNGIIRREDRIFGTLLP